MGQGTQVESGYPVLEKWNWESGERRTRCLSVQRRELSRERELWKTAEEYPLNIQLKNKYNIVENYLSSAGRIT